MKMLPAQIDIGGHRFDVRVVERREAVHRDVPHGIGATDVLIEEITLRGPDELSEDLAMETLLHEVLHGVAAVHKLSLSEKDVRRLAPALQYVLQRNPLLVEAITGRQFAREGHEHA